MSKLVYLAGPIHDCSYEDCVGWREIAINQLAKHGITGVSPMRSKEFLKPYPKLLDGMYKHPLTTEAGIVTRDMWDVMRCDAVLFNLIGSKRVSIGTVIEYGWASAFKKPIITVIEKEGNIHEHSMIRRLTGFQVDNLEDSLRVIKSLFDY